MKITEARDRMFEAAGSVEVLAAALAELDVGTLPGGYSACYAIKRLIDDAAELIAEAADAEASK